MDGTNFKMLWTNNSKYKPENANEKFARGSVTQIVNPKNNENFAIDI